MNIETFSPLLFPLSGGFFAAWVFYGLTPFSKPSGYERTVQALIFTIIVEVLSFFAEKIPFFETPESYQLPLNVLCGAIVGLVAGLCAQNDLPHKWLRKIGLTDQISYGWNNWIHVFNHIQKETGGKWEAVLHFKDGRRLQGSPDMWPNTAGSGHFWLKNYFWLSEGEEKHPPDQATSHSAEFSILIDSADINMVEFIPARKTNHQ